MGRKVRMAEEVREDYKRLDGAIRKQVSAGIYKMSQTPLSSPHRYGKPLGNKSGNNLTGFFKTKYRGVRIRVIYTLSTDEMATSTVVISERDDNCCYNLASALYKKYGKELFTGIFEGLDSGEQSEEQWCESMGGG